MSCRFTKQLMPCDTILATLAFIFSFSACSISATLAIESTRTRLPKILILSVSMAVLAMSTRAFSMRLGWPTPIFLLRIKPSSKYESCACEREGRERKGGRAAPEMSRSEGEAGDLQRARPHR